MIKKIIGERSGYMSTEIFLHILTAEKF